MRGMDGWGRGDADEACGRGSVSDLILCHAPPVSDNLEGLYSRKPRPREMNPRPSLPYFSLIPTQQCPIAKASTDSDPGPSPGLNTLYYVLASLIHVTVVIICIRCENVCGVTAGQALQQSKQRGPPTVLLGHSSVLLIPTLTKLSSIPQGSDGRTV